jgi:hypothetical protein
MRWWRKSFCLILIPALLATSANAQSPTQGPAEKSESAARPHEDATASQKQISPDAWPSVAVVAKEPPAPTATKIIAVLEQQPYKHWWDSPNAPEWALFFLTIPYVSVTIGLFVVTKKVANVARQQAVLLLAVERPLITLIAVTLDEKRHYRRLSDGRLTLRSGLKPVLEVVFANFGRTAAFDIRMRVEFAISETVPKERPAISMGPQVPGVVLPPSVSDKPRGGTLNTEWATEITQADADAIRRGARVFYFWGVIDYSDAAGTHYHTGIGGSLNLDRDPEAGMFDLPTAQGYNYQT